MDTKNRTLLKDTRSDMADHITEAFANGMAKTDTFGTTVPGVEVEFETYQRVNSIDGVMIDVSIKVRISDPFLHTPSDMLGCPEHLHDVSQHMADLETELLAIINENYKGGNGDMEFKYITQDSEPGNATYMFT